MSQKPNKYDEWLKRQAEAIERAQKSPHRCEDCGTLWHVTQLDAIDPLQHANGEAATGQCPDEICQGLCYLVPTIRQSQDRLDALLSMKSDGSPIPAELATTGAVIAADEVTAADAPLKVMRVEDYLAAALIELDTIKAVSIDDTQHAEAHYLDRAREGATCAAHHIRRALDQLHAERTEHRAILELAAGRRGAIRSEPSQAPRGEEHHMRSNDPNDRDPSTRQPASTPTPPGSRGSEPSDVNDVSGDKPSTQTEDSDTKSGEADEASADR